MEFYRTLIASLVGASGIGPREDVLGPYSRAAASKPSIPPLLGILGPFIMASVFGVAFVVIGQTDFTTFSNTYIKIVFGLSFVLHALLIVGYLGAGNLLAVLVAVFSFCLMALQVLASLSILQALLGTPSSEDMLLAQYRSAIAGIVPGLGSTVGDGETMLRHGKAIAYDIGIAVIAGLILWMIGVGGRRFAKA